MMATTESSTRPTFVLGVAAIRWGIEQLTSQQIHPFFPAYLEIRRLAAQNESLKDIHPRWEDLEQYLRVPGGPPNKPNFRPFWNQSSSAGQHWLNANLAGSYSRSSIRDVPRRVIDVEDTGGFSLKEKHWKLAREHLLYGQQLPVIPLATFLYRDFGFTTDGPSIRPQDLVQVFRRDFGYQRGSDDAEFEHLYATALSARTDWFERWESPRPSED